ncbi:MAG: MSCRAMM family protein [Ignavibacteriaceae bacterium]
MKRFLYLSILILLKGTSLYAQLQVYPDTIEFKDEFHRLASIYLINKDTVSISIDSVYYSSKINYQSNFYLTRFNKSNNNITLINPGDTLEMDCILSGYFEVSPADSIDTMLLATSNRLTIPIKIKIDFYKEYYTGVINGVIKNGTTALDSADIYFFYNGNFLVKKITADNTGYYSTVLPVGKYTVAVERKNYKLTFYNQQSSPFNATMLILNQNDSAAINFNLSPITDTGFSINGIILDRVSKSTIHGGYVIVRHGTHTPSKIESNTVENDYAGIINPDGSFKIDNITPGTYLVQSYSGYYTPTYYTSLSNTAEFWQQADSIVINKNLTNLSISMARDSSYGNGMINGTVTSNLSSFDFSNVIVYAISVFDADTVIYNYAIADSLGNFEIDRLPYGDYKLIAQKINYPDEELTNNVIISPSNQVVNGINIHFNIDNINNNNILPISSKLFQNFPNPFNPETVINYSISQTEFVKIRIYDLLGRTVTILVNEEKPKGEYSVKFVASGLPSGVYFYRMQAGSFVQTKKLIFMK